MHKIKLPINIGIVVLKDKLYDSTQCIYLKCTQSCCKDSWHTHYVSVVSSVVKHWHQNDQPSTTF